MQRLDIRSYRHEREQSRYIVAQVGLLLVLAAFVGVAVLTAGTALLVLLQIPLSFIALQVLRASHLGNMAKVSHINFPQVYALAREIGAELGYDKSVHIYVFQQGDVNFFWLQVLGYRELLLPSGLLEGVMDPASKQELRWILASGIARLKARHSRFAIVRDLISAIEGFAVFNVFFFPWERATHLSGDRISLALGQDLEAAVSCLLRLMLGNDLARQASVAGILKQQQTLAGNLWGYLALTFRAHPPLVERVAELIRWARDHDPAAYQKFLEKAPERDRLEALVGLTIHGW